VRAIASQLEINMENPQEYYLRDGAMTASVDDSAIFRELPRDILALCRIVQGVLIHQDLASFAYGVAVSREQSRERPDSHRRPLAEILSRIHELDGQAFAVARSPDRRMACVCRHFSVMLSAILHAQGIAARSRCGFAAYFRRGNFEDHWIAEYWNAEQGRWILVDAQLDDVQCKFFRIDFDPLDVPRDRFVMAGDAWRRCRAGRADPNRFGLSLVPHLHGLWYVAGNLVRDLAALNRMEMLPWDLWGLMGTDDSALSEENKSLLDRVAALTLSGDRTFAQVRSIYEGDDRLRVPPVVLNAMRGATEAIRF
jgi:hypothetical protein